MTDNDINFHRAELLRALDERVPLIRLANQHVAEIPKPTKLEELEACCDAASAVVDDVLGDVYRRIALHSSAIMKLSTDADPTALARKIQKLTRAELNTYRDAIMDIGDIADEVEAATTKLRLFGSMIMEIPRQIQLRDATNKLRDYGAA